MAKKLAKKRFNTVEELDKLVSKSGGNGTIHLSEIEELARALGFTATENLGGKEKTYTNSEFNISFNMLVSDKEIGYQFIKRTILNKFYEAEERLKEKTENEKKLPDGFNTPEGWSAERNGNHISAVHNAVDFARFQFTIKETGELDSQALAFNGKFREFDELIKSARVASTESFKQLFNLENDLFKVTYKNLENGGIGEISISHKYYDDLELHIDTAAAAGILSQSQKDDINKLRDKEIEKILERDDLIGRLVKEGFKLNLKETFVTNDSQINEKVYELKHPNIYRDSIIFTAYENNDRDRIIKNDEFENLKEFEKDYQKYAERRKSKKPIEDFTIKDDRGLKRTLFLFDTDTLSVLTKTSLDVTDKVPESKNTSYLAFVERLAALPGTIVGFSEMIMYEFSGKTFNHDGSGKISLLNRRYLDSAEKERFDNLTDKAGLIDINEKQIRQGTNSSYLVFRTEVEGEKLYKMRYKYRDKDYILNSSKSMLNKGSGENSLIRIATHLDLENVNCIVLVSNDQNARERFVGSQDKSDKKLAAVDVFALVDAMMGAKEKSGGNESIMYNKGFRETVSGERLAETINYRKGYKIFNGDGHSEHIDIDRLIKVIAALQNNDSPTASITAYADTYHKLIAKNGNGVGSPN